MKRLAPLLLVLIIFLAAIAATTLLTKGAPARQDTLSVLSEQLAQGVPVKEIRLYGQSPLRIEVTVQGSSNANQAAPDDPLFEQTIQRDVALLQNRDGVTIDRVKVIILNIAGLAIYESETTVSEEIFVQIPKQDDVSAAALVRAELNLAGMTLDRLDVSSDTAGARTLSIQLSVADAEAATAAIQTFIPSLSALTDTLNSQQDTQIATCKVSIVDANQRLMLNYSRDVQLSQESWWQAADITQNWAPSVSPTQLPAPTTQVGMPTPGPLTTRSSDPIALPTVAYP